MRTKYPDVLSLVSSSRPQRNVILNPYIFANGAFDPSSIAGLKLWLKADALSLADGDPVSTWPDASGNGNDATQATSSKQPVLHTGVIGGKPVVRFDGVDDALDVSVSPGSALSLFLVLSPMSGSSVGYLFTPWSQGNASDGALGFYSLPSDGVAGIIRPTTGPCVYSMVIADVNNGALFLDGGSEVDFNPWTRAEYSLVTGYDEATAFHLNGSGDIAEVLIYDVALPSTDRHNVEVYLGTKYGITIS